MTIRPPDVIARSKAIVQLAKFGPDRFPVAGWLLRFLLFLLLWFPAAFPAAAGAGWWCGVTSLFCQFRT
jgi:hypothetical protein